ncbi:ras-related protein Rab-34 isoform X1 [Chlorocebus sabaeus]|uniref:ras-related protein Rab-34 isoform X1 n=1 Tax=Chlorocebus sabaeus TaxID=60711 RepID=UPI00045D7FEF
MVGQPQPRDDVGSPRSRVIVGAIRPRVIVGSARARPTPDGTPRPQLAAEESPRPRVIFGTPRARVVVGSPRPRVIVSSPWPAVVVASPRPRAPVGSPWPRVVVGTPRPRVIVGSPRARVAGADPASAPSQGALQGRRQDEHSGARAEGSRPGRAAPDLRSPRSLWWGTCRWERLASLIGSAKTPLIRIIRPPLEWTSRWNDLRCWVSPSVCSCECFHTPSSYPFPPAPTPPNIHTCASLLLPPSWDTAGQERFKCIASTYYRGAQAIIVVFNLNDVASLEHTKQWLADALKENDPSSVLLFLVGSKKDLSTPAQYALMEKDALQVAQEMKAEYWAVSSLTGENVREFFFRVAALTFEANVLAELERSGARRIGDVVRINSDDSNLYLTASKKKPTCCP